MKHDYLVEIEYLFKTTKISFWLYLRKLSTNFSDKFTEIVQEMIFRNM